MSNSVPVIQPDEYVVESLGPNYEGWFPFAEGSLSAGSSGAGKTTIMIPLIERASRGENVFGHCTKPRTYRILLRDRSLASFRRTLRRLKASKELQKNVVRVTADQQLKDCSDVVEDILREGRVDLIFIEGIDMWCHGGDASDFNVVCELLDKLQAVAEKWHVAIVASIGSPKQKAKDRYELLRDSIYWNRCMGPEDRNNHVHAVDRFEKS